MKTKLNYKQLREAIAEKSKLIGTIFEEAGEELDFSRVKCLGEGDTAAKVEKIKALNAELSDLKADYEEYTLLAKSRQTADDAAGFKGDLPKGNPGDSKAKKSLGELFVESEAYRNKGATATLDVDMKALMQTGAGFAPESTRLPRVELYPLRTLRVAQLFPTFPTGMDTIKYMEETTIPTMRLKSPKRPMLPARPLMVKLPWLSLRDQCRLKKSQCGFLSPKSS